MIEAHDGEEARELAETSNADLILMGVRLPGLDAYEVSHRIKAVPALKRSPTARGSCWRRYANTFEP